MTRRRSSRRRSGRPGRRKLDLPWLRISSWRRRKRRTKRRKVNVRALIVVLASLLLVGASLLLASTLQRGRHARAFLREADRAEREERIEEAVRHLSRYVRLAPRDADAAVRLGTLLADLGHWDPAYAQLEQVARLWPDRQQSRRRLVEVAIRLGRFPDAREHLERHLLPTAPDDPELIEQLAACRAGMGEWAEAADWLIEAIEVAPTRVAAYRMLARLLQTHLDRPAEADEWIESLLEANPGCFRALVVAGQYFREFGTAERAAELAAQAMAVAPEEPGVLLLAADCARDVEDYDEARRLIRRAIELAPEALVPYASLAEIEVRAGDREAAITVLQEGIAACGPHTDLLWNLANYYVEAGEVDSARNTIERLRAAGQPEALLTYLTARIDLAAGEWLRASRRLERARAGLSEWPDLVKQADLMLGACYQQMGNADQQLAAFRRAVNADPQSAAGRLGIVSALMAAGRIEEAIAEMRNVAHLRGAPPESLIDLGRLMVLRNLRADRSQRRWEDVEAVLDQAQLHLPEAPQVPILRAEVLVARNRPQEADALLAAAVEDLPGRAEIHAARALLAQRQEDGARAEALLNAAEDALGDGAVLRLARAELLLGRGGADAESLARLAENVDDWQPEEQVRLWRSLAGVAMQAGAYDLGRTLCRQVAARQPTDLRARTLLFDVALLAEDDTGMEAALEEIRQIEGEGPLWHYGRAVLLRLRAGDGDADYLAQAQQHIAAARTMRPNWARLPALEAEILELRGESDLALDRHLQAIDRGERNPETIRHVVEMLFRQQRFARADRVLRLLEEQQLPFSGDLGRLAAEISLQLHNFDRALDMAERVAAASATFEDHLWLGQVFRVMGQRAQSERREDRAAAFFAEAESEFRRAVELGGELAAPHVALVQFLHRIGEEEAAAAAIAAAPLRAADEGASLIPALCYEAIGALDEAAEGYAAALAETPNDPRLVRAAADFFVRHGRTAEAERQLHRFLDDELEATEEDVTWARRGLATVLLSRGSRESFDQALAFLEENLASPAASVEDRRAKAFVLAAYPERARLREAVQTIEGVVHQQRPPNPEDLFLLAQLYHGDGDWAAAAAQMRRLLASHGYEPRYVAWYAASLLQRGELGQADVWLGQLQQIAPDAFQTANLRARAAFERGRYDTVLAVIAGYLGRDTSQPAEPEVRRQMASSTLERFARRLRERGELEQAAALAQRAEELLSQGSLERPTEGLSLAAFLGRQGRTDEALARIDAAWEEAGTAELATAITAAAGGQPTAAQWAELDTRLERALEEHGRAVPLLIAQAELHSRRGDFDAAEAVYRRILAEHPTAVVALNNLAMLLAVREEQLDDALALVQQAVAIAGPVPELLDTRAVIHLVRGEAELALDDLRQVLAVTPTARGRFREAQALLAAGRVTDAAEALAAARDLGLAADHIHPMELAAYRDVVDELAADLAAMRRGIEAAGPHTDLLWNLGNYLVEAGRFDEARDVLDRLREIRHPESMLALLDARIDRALGAWGEAAHKLERARPGLTEWPELLLQADLLLGSSYEAMGIPDRQLAAFRRALQTDSLSVTARRGVIRALAAAGRLEEAVAEAHYLSRFRGAPAGNLVDLARLMTLKFLHGEGATHRWREVEAVLDEAEGFLPQNPQIAVLRAELLVAQDRLDEAEHLLEAAQDARPDSFEIGLARASLARRQGDWARAETLLDAASAKWGDGPALRAARGQFLVERDGARASAALAELAEDVGTWPEDDRVALWSDLAELALAAGDLELAERLARRLGERELADLAVHRLAVDVALHGGDPAALETALEAIAEIEGEGPLWHFGRAALLVLQASAGTGDDSDPAAAPAEEQARTLLAQAQEHLAAARRLRPAWARLPALAAEIYELQGDSQLALEQHLQALARGERDPAAIRGVFAALYRRQRFAEVDRVLDLLENRRQPFSDALGRMAAAVSLRLHGFEEALEILRSEAQSAGGAEDFVWLGHVYSVLGQRARAAGSAGEATAHLEEAEAAFRRALEIDGKPQAHVALVQFLHRFGRPVEVERALAAAPERAEDAEGTLVRAHCLEALGRTDAAAQQYAAALAEAPDDLRLVRRAAEFHLRHGMHAPAEEQLRRLLDAGAAAAEEDVRWGRRHLATILLDRGGDALDEARGLLEANLASADASPEDRRTMALLLSASQDAADRQEAARMLEAVVHEAPYRPEDVFRLARLYADENDWSRAAAQMRRLLAGHGYEPPYVAWYAAALIERDEAAEAAVWLRQLERIAPEILGPVGLSGQAGLHPDRFDAILMRLRTYLEQQGLG